MEHERRQLDEDRERIMNAVREAVDTSVKIAILTHTTQCPLGVVKEQHDRMHIELFNGDDGKHGFIAEARAFFTTQTDRALQSDKRKVRNRFIVGTILASLTLILTEPIKSGWQDMQSLIELAHQSPDIIQLTKDWKEFYANPPIHQMDPAPIVTPPEAQPFPRKHTQPRKPKESFFDYDPKGVGLLKEPAFQTDTIRENW